jgi:hypothetical protein
MAQDFHINPETGHWDDNYWANTGRFLAGQGGGGGDPYAGMRGPNFADFKFDYSAAEKAALAKLAPYYRQMLDLNNGDVERAKQAIEADYQTGKRSRQGDYTGQMAQEQNTAQEEQTNTIDDLNKRGVLFQETPPGQPSMMPQASGQEPGMPVGIEASAGDGKPNPLGQPGNGIGYSALAKNQFFDPLLDKQQQRRAAIQRAIQRQSETATTQYTKETGDNTSSGLRSNLGLAQEKQDKALGMTQNAYQVARNQYEAGTANTQINPYLQQ